MPRPRGQMLKDEAERRAMMTRARTSAAEECTQCRLAIGQCSCNGGGATTQQRVSVIAAVQPTTTVADSRFSGVVAPGGAVNSGHGLSVEADGAGGWVVVPDVRPGGYPARLCDRMGQPVGWGRAMREVMMRGYQEPYVDPGYDMANMDTLYSDIVTATPGVPITIPTSPEVGTFAAFYYSVVAVDPATQVSQVDWRITRPSVIGCPTPCANPGPILAQFVMRAQDNGCCPGIPMTAFLDERTRNVPLSTPFTNNQAAGDLLVQIEVRGYCCSDRIC